MKLLFRLIVLSLQKAERDKEVADTALENIKKVRTIQRMEKLEEDIIIKL